MEEMMMVMMKIKTPPNNNINLKNIPITTSASPTWKLYENPFYISHKKPQAQEQQDYSADHRQIHRLHLPISARKIAASFWDLTFIRPSELEMARAQISELKAELECERKSRKKTECLNKRIGMELLEERKGREALEKVCQQLAKEISADKAEIIRMRKEMEQERKMLRTAEVIREERVQMKLSEANMLLEERLSEIEISKKIGGNVSSSNTHQTFGEKIRFVLGEKMSTSVNSMQTKCSAENPHIRRGIKGFVEFPKAIGCRSGSNHLGSKLECQKAKLKILLKQKGAVGFNGLIAS